MSRFLVTIVLHDVSLQCLRLHLHFCLAGTSFAAFEEYSSWQLQLTASSAHLKERFRSRCHLPSTRLGHRAELRATSMSDTVCSLRCSKAVWHGKVVYLWVSTSPALSRRAARGGNYSYTNGKCECWAYRLWDISKNTLTDTDTDTVRHGNELGPFLRCAPSSVLFAGNSKGAQREKRELRCGLEKKYF